MIPIKIICWNCRGISNTNTLDRIKYFMNHLKPNIVCLMETKASAECIQRFCSRFKSTWDWAAIPTLDFSSGIITLWSRTIGTVILVAVSLLEPHLVISN